MNQSSLFEQEVTQHATIRPLRPRQLDAIRQIREAIGLGHKRIILQASTGFGKTLLSAHIIAAALRKGSRPLFTAPAISLIDQTLEAFEREGIHDIGVMQASHPRTNHAASVQIATLQTLARRGAINPGFVIQDEAHEMRDDFNALLDSAAWKDKVVIGLSATPWSKGMGNRWTKLIIAATYRDMIDDGLAREFTVYGPPKDIDREGIGVSKGEFEEAGSSAAMSDATIVGNVLEEWKEHSTHEKTFAFCVNRAHAQVQMEAFLDDGIPFGYIDANTPQGTRDTEKGTRKHIFAQMRSGEIAGICSVGCLIRGVDEIVYNILDLQPCKSEIRHVQKWGRMRTSDPSATYMGFDHAGNNASLGMFWDIYHDTLDTRAPGDRKQAFEDEDKPAKPRKCPKCFFLIPPGARNCPQCKERLPIYPGITEKDGKLVEMVSYGPKAQADFAMVQEFLEARGMRYLSEYGWQNGYDIARKHGYKGPKPEVAEPKPVKPQVNKEHQRIYSELLSVARKANFKDAWAFYKFQEMVGIKPTGLKTRGKTQASEDVKQFVAEQRRKYLAAKKGLV